MPSIVKSGKLSKSRSYVESSGKYIVEVSVESIYIYPIWGHVESITLHYKSHDIKYI